MLILTRREGESIIIGDDDNRIEVVFLSFNGNQIRLGINAPKCIPVYRDEIFERIIAERNLKRSRYEEEQ